MPKKRRKKLSPLAQMSALLTSIKKAKPDKPMPRDNEEFLAEDHWSSPNGCHPDCPTCEAERTEEQQAQHEERERLHAAAPALLAACQSTLADMNHHSVNESTRATLLTAIALTHKKNP